MKALPLVNVTISVNRSAAKILKARIGEQHLADLMAAVSHEGDIFSARVQAIVDCYNQAAPADAKRVS